MLHYSNSEDILPYYRNDKWCNILKNYLSKLNSITEKTQNNENLLRVSSNVSYISSNISCTNKYSLPITHKTNHTLFERFPRNHTDFIITNNSTSSLYQMNLPPASKTFFKGFTYKPPPKEFATPKYFISNESKIKMKDLKFCLVRNNQTYYRNINNKEDEFHNSMSVQTGRRKIQKRNKTNKDVFYRYLRNKSLNKTLALYK